MPSPLETSPQPPWPQALPRPQAPVPLAPAQRRSPTSPGRSRESLPSFSPAAGSTSHWPPLQGSAQAALCGQRAWQAAPAAVPPLPPVPFYFQLARLLGSPTVFLLARLLGSCTPEDSPAVGLPGQCHSPQSPSPRAPKSFIWVRSSSKSESLFLMARTLARQTNRKATPCTHAARSSQCG